MNAIREKILLLLLGGLAFGCSYTGKKQHLVLKKISKEWNGMNKKDLRTEINYLHRFKFIEKKNKKDGSIAIILTKKGKFKALNYQLENIKNKKEEWDKKWRLVSFDIPEQYKIGRDALRRKLKKVGFHELQKSVLITPFNCKKEIMELIKYFNLDKYVRFGVLESIDNEKYLKKVFKII